MPAPNRNSRIGVAILTHNRRAEVLRSLARLTSLPEKPPIVLVDNASTDGTIEAVAAKYPQVQIIAAGKNLGAAGRNLALRRLAGAGSRSVRRPPTAGRRHGPRTRRRPRGARSDVSADGG